MKERKKGIEQILIISSSYLFLTVEALFLKGVLVLSKSPFNPFP
jgi:hypothetical protein